MEVPVKVEPSNDTVEASESAEPKQPQAMDTSSAQAQPTGPPPVMDVRPPETSAPATAEQPVKPVEQKQPEKPIDEKPADLPKPVIPKKPRQPGVGLAIVATIVIVLGLAALATYAYLKTAR